MSFKTLIHNVLWLLCLFILGCNPSQFQTETIPTNNDDKVADNGNINSDKVVLGEALFKDENLSLDRSMSCSSCHNPDSGFIDTRSNSVDGAVSIGQDGISFGDRNSPTISYARYIPALSVTRGDYSGGLFMDGRVDTLTEQAKEPFLNTLEMQMPSEQSVVDRVLENSDYINSLTNLYGASVLDDTSATFDAIADAIAEYEKSDELSPFDSRFDQGSLSAQEVRGRNLFRTSGCITCHSDNGTNPLFTNFNYENLGVPANDAVRSLNGQSTDLGLYENPNVTGLAQRGRFRVPTLRNIAVSAPYMHNGVFQELKTVVHFYNTRDVAGAINPETGQTWQAAEVSTNVVNANVGNLGLSDSDEDDIVAFLSSLTDRQFE